MRERERERETLSERQLGRHSSRLSRTSLCDFYTRSDFLAARLALARQIYVPQPYKSRAYKDIEAKANENSSSHPLSSPCCSLFGRAPLLREPRYPIILFATILGIPLSSFSTASLLLTTIAFPSFFAPSLHPLPFREAQQREQEYEESRRASPITGSVSSRHRVLLYSASTNSHNRLTYLPDPHRYAHDRKPNKLLLNRVTALSVTYIFARNLSRNGNRRFAAAPNSKPSDSSVVNSSHLSSKQIVTYASVNSSTLNYIAFSTG